MAEQGKDNFKLLSRRGYICYLMKDDDYDLDLSLIHI